MKKLGLALLTATTLFVGCSSVQPICATSNRLGSKVGEATATYLFGYLPLGGADASIQTAARNSGITMISTVDQKVTLGFFTTNVTTIVTGE